ncbi:MAG: hypothetical protein H7832_11190 [Magnetococcus sp. DMHC-6]
MSNWSTELFSFPFIVLLPSSLLLTVGLIYWLRLRHIEINLLRRLVARLEDSPLLAEASETVNGLPVYIQPLSKSLRVEGDRWLTSIEQKFADLQQTLLNHMTEQGEEQIQVMRRIDRQIDQTRAALAEIDDTFSPPQTLTPLLNRLQQEEEEWLQSRKQAMEQFFNRALKEITIHPPQIGKNVDNADKIAHEVGSYLASHEEKTNRILDRLVHNMANLMEKDRQKLYENNQNIFKNFLGQILDPNELSQVLDLSPPPLTQPTSPIYEEPSLETTPPAKGYTTFPLMEEPIIEEEEEKEEEKEEEECFQDPISHMDTSFVEIKIPHVDNHFSQLLQNHFHSRPSIQKTRFS